VIVWGTNTCTRTSFRIVRSRRLQPTQKHNARPGHISLSINSREPVAKSPDSLRHHQSSIHCSTASLPRLLPADGERTPVPFLGFPEGRNPSPNPALSRTPATSRSGGGEGGRRRGRGGGPVLYVRSSVPARRRRRRRRRIRTRSALESAPMASAQEKAAACCVGGAPARGAPVAVRAIPESPSGKVEMAASDERVAASAVGGGVVIEEIATVQPTIAKASSKGILGSSPLPSLFPSLIDRVGL
jgi:hypothetical protein